MNLPEDKPLDVYFRKKKERKKKKLVVETYSQSGRKIFGYILLVGSIIRKKLAHTTLARKWRWALYGITNILSCRSFSVMKYIYTNLMLIKVSLEVPIDNDNGPGGVYSSFTKGHLKKIVRVSRYASTSHRNNFMLLEQKFIARWSLCKKGRWPNLESSIEFVSFRPH